MTRTQDMKAEGDQTWVVVKKKGSKRPSTTEKPKWRPKDTPQNISSSSRSYKGSKRDKRKISSESHKSSKPQTRKSTSSSDELERVTPKSPMKYSASAPKLSIKSFKLVGQPELRSSRSSQSLSKLSGISPSASSLSLSGLSSSSDDMDVRCLDNSESESEKDLIDWKQALMEAIKEKSSQSVEVPESIVRALCALSSISASPSTTPSPTLLS